MTGNAMTDDLELAGTRRIDCPTPPRQAAEAAAGAARLAEIGRKYTLQVIVTDPEGREVLNLTKMTLKRDSHDQGNTTPDIQDVMALLIDAAREHVIPFE